MSKMKRQYREWEEALRATYLVRVNLQLRKELTQLNSDNPIKRWAEAWLDIPQGRHAGGQQTRRGARHPQSPGRCTSKPVSCHLAPVRGCHQKDEA